MSAHAEAKIFLVSTALADAIYDIAASGNIDCAVAFWGNGAERMFGDCNGRALRIICNLRMGGTNPDVIARMRDTAEIRHCDMLHAKVYLGHDRAVVTSANASANGLGVDGASPATWVEAGYLTTETGPIRDWFEKLWQSCHPVTEADLAAAKNAWIRHQKSAARSPPPSFADYIVGDSDFPLISWWDTVGEGQTNRAVLRGVPVSERNTLERSIELGELVEDDADRPYLSQVRWVLRFGLRRDGHLSRQRLWFVRLLGRTVEDAWSDEGGRPMPVALASADQSGRPFNEREEAFVAAFRELIETTRYASLRERNVIAWFAPRIDEMHQFWHDLKDVYRTKNSDT